MLQADQICNLVLRYWCAVHVGDRWCRMWHNGLDTDRTSYDLQWMLKDIK